MKITLEEMVEVAKRLPIGYYLGRKTPVIVEMGASAYCNTINGEIHIGIGLLQQAAKNIDSHKANKWNKEILLRCLLYHEIGHLLLTPQNLFHCCLKGINGQYLTDKERHSFFNIFEDERIERLLDKVFWGVDFKEFCKLVNKGGTQSKTDVDQFFAAVRLRNTTPTKSLAIDKAISELKDCTAVDNFFFYLAGKRDRYLTVLANLMKTLLDEDKDENNNKEEDKNNSEKKEEGKDKNEEKDNNKDKDDGGQEQNPSGENEQKQGKNEQEQGGNEDKESPTNRNKGKNEDEKDENKNSNGSGNNSEKGGDDENKNSSSSPSPNEEQDKDEEQNLEDDAPNENGKPTGMSGAPATTISPETLRQLASVVFGDPTQDIQNTLNRFAVRLAKKRGTQTAGCWSGLHGRLESKRDAMDKDKIFRRRSDVGDKLMQSVNLTLWVDHSRSFYNSKDKLNQILTAVYRTHKMSTDKLSVNVVKMGVHALVARDAEWAVDPQGNNSINHTYANAWNQTRKKDRRNIDIVVFDGVCGYVAEGLFLRRKCGAYFESHKKYEVGIANKIWNSHDCWVVSDKGNEEFFTLAMPKAHITYIEGGYAKHLQAKVMDILNRIL